MMRKEIYCTNHCFEVLFCRLSCGNVFVSMDYDSISERITSSIADGEKELEDLKKEKETMEEELNVFFSYFKSLSNRILKRSYMLVLVILLS